jgi:protein-L-isoaspartate(D-aspartate) O-methyltransferase
MDFDVARKLMVDSQVRVNDVTDRALQAALLTVPRERFLPADRAHEAYAELAPRIAEGRALMLPRDVSKLLQALEARPGERALAIAGPYAAAVLARMGLAVTAQEADAALADTLRPVLSDEGVELVSAPFDQPAGGDWDLIVSEAAAAVRPRVWLDALRPGGRLAVVERASATGRAVLYVRGRDGMSRRELFDAAPPVLAEMTPAPTFAL